MSGLRWRWLLLLGAVALLLGAEAGEGPNGFSLEGARVPRASILAGGPPRDGIPSVDEPHFAPPEEATWTAPTNPVLGVALDGEAHAYPVHLIEWHQVVNDSLGQVPVVVAYDPLTGVPRAFRRDLPGGRTLTFGVSGLLYNSSFLLYDRETESLWLQFTGEAIAGPLAGKRLTPLTVRQEPRDLWLSQHPDTLILARPEPKHIDYRYSPYKAYWVKDEIPFPVKAEDHRFHAKELVLGVVVDGKARAYLGSILTAAGGHVEDEFQGKKIRVDYSSELASFVWEVPEGVEVTEAYWFAWKAFHPDTDAWQPPAAERAPQAPGTGDPTSP